MAETAFLPKVCFFGCRTLFTENLLINWLINQLLRSGYIHSSHVSNSVFVAVRYYERVSANSQQILIIFSADLLIYFNRSCCQLRTVIGTRAGKSIFWLENSEQFFSKYNLNNIFWRMNSEQLTDVYCMASHIIYF